MLGGDGDTHLRWEPLKVSFGRGGDKSLRLKKEGEKKNCQTEKKKKKYD